MSINIRAVLGGTEKPSQGRTQRGCCYLDSEEEGHNKTAVVTSCCMILIEYAYDTLVAAEGSDEAKPSDTTDHIAIRQVASDPPLSKT